MPFLSRIFLFFVSSSLVGFLVTLWSYFQSGEHRTRNEKADEIAKLIRQGALAFLHKEYTVLSLVMFVAVLIMGYTCGWLCASVFLAGAICSMVAGYIGMIAATKANLHTTIAARDYGEQKAFNIALAGGSVMGFLVASLGLLGLAILFFLFVHSSMHNFNQILTCFGLGASSIALFARMGGGIYTKAADVGADLVGKVEVGIPEDDPRNPAVIADNVGDCVGDVAGMGADLFESYVGSVLSAIIIAFNRYSGDLVYISLPLSLSAIGLCSSALALYLIPLAKLPVEKVLQRVSQVATALFIAMSFLYVKWMGIEMALFGSMIVGALCGIIIGLFTDYYTSGSPIKKLAEVSQSGPATNLIYGLALGFESVVFPVWTLAGAVFVSYAFFGGLYGVAIAAVSMLSTVAIIMTIDAYGPIADNAGGISEMSGFGPSVRAITDKLDALGNTTAALGKGFSIGSAALAALAIFVAYCDEAHIKFISILDPAVICGIFIGGTMPFLLSAFTMRSVGKAAWKMVIEVRRQFRETPGLLQGHGQPQYERCIAISTQAALVEMILPGIIMLIAPIVVRYIFGQSGAVALGGFLAGVTITGVPLSLFMANAGGCWDNTKKYIEAQEGGKGSAAHKAAVIGDTVGDPFKDTSGPSINILLKLMAVISLLIATITCN